MKKLYFLDDDEANAFIDFLIVRLHDISTSGDCVSMDCLDQLKQKYYSEFMRDN